MKKLRHEDFVAVLPRELQKKIKNCTRDLFEHVTTEFIRTCGLRMRSADWLNDFMPEDFYLHGDVEAFRVFEPLHDTTHFIPFVEKVRVPQGSRICVIGDVHGDFPYLVEVMKELVKQGVLDKDYKIIDPHFYIAFVGDYTNRNLHSIDVVLTLFYLNRLNVGRVFLLRGNHEYAISTRVVYEIYQKLLEENRGNLEHHYFKDAFIAEMSRRFSIYTFPDFLYWFDYLPLSLYIGSFDDEANAFQYVNVCHGGIEPGYSPHELLASSARFERIKTLDRHSAMMELCGKNGVPGAEERFKVSLQVCDELNQKSFTASYRDGSTPINLIERHGPRHLRFGMQWNSFLSESNDAILMGASKKHRNLLFGSAMTRWFLDRWSSEGNKVISMIRGHQHLDDEDESIGLKTMMLSELRVSKGLVRQWGGAVYNMGDSGAATGWQSFVMITTGKTKADWTYSHYFKNSADTDFQEHKAPFIDEQK